MALRPMSEARFLKLSEGIPDYAGPDLDRVQALMMRAHEDIDSGAKLVPEAELDAALRELGRARSPRQQPIAYTATQNGDPLDASRG